MSTKTPTKNDSLVNGNLFSPVILPESPVAGSPNKNLTGLPRVARDIAADVYNNIQKWNNKHIDGANIVKDIAVLKANNSEQFPDGLESLVKKLYDTVQNLSIYSNALIFLSSQMKALAKLHTQTNPLFISMSIDKLTSLVQEVSDAYKAEFKVKEYVLENVAHSKNRNEVLFHAACWTHQQFISDNIALKVEALLTETGHRKIT